MDHYFAFDFDGVICDSARETGLSAWRAAHTLWPSRFEADPPPEYVARFPVLRPVIETGWENMVLVALMQRGLDDEQLLADFHALGDAFIEEERLDRAALRRCFAEARDRRRDEDLDAWFGVQGFYPGVVEAINALPAPRCIITTKEERFARALIERAGLEVEPERIYGLEAFENRGKRSVLEALAAEFPGATLHFFEDRLATLERMVDLPRTALYLVDWGYNTAAERARAADAPQVTVLDRTNFERVLSSTVSPD